MDHHLILFDATCPLCNNAVNRIRRWDKQHIFMYTPLDSALAGQLYAQHPSLKGIDSLILLEKFDAHQARIWMRGRAVFRILWLLGGYRKLIGWMAYFPFGVDAIYRFIARHRHKF
jgi:predicted DCC family thiol-disulfide oxidoreductase YuxK